METYQLVTTGQWVQGKEPAAVLASLQQQKFPEQLLKAIVAGKKVRLKKSASWEQAKAYQKRLHTIGLKTAIRLEFTPEVFSKAVQSLTPPVQNTVSTPEVPVNQSGQARVEDIQSQKAGPQTSAIVWIRFDKNQLLPSLVAMPKTVDIDQLRGGILGKLVTHSVYIKPFWLFALSLVLGIVSQNYLIRVMSSYWHWGTMASVMGIIILLAWPMCISRMLQPRSMLSIQLGKLPPLFLQEQPRLWIGTKHYSVFNEEGILQGEIHRKHNWANYINTNGEQPFSWDKKRRVAFDETDAAGEIRSALLDDNLLGEILEGFEHLKNLKNFFIKPPPPEKIDWHKQYAQAIFDSDNQCIALCYTDPYLILEILTDSLDNQAQAELYLFAIALMREGLL